MLLFHVITQTLVLFQGTLQAVALPPKVAEDVPVEAGELLASVVLFRHGDRTPLYPYPTDPYKDQSNWPEGFGQLTAKGKLMLYQLGKYLRKRYGNILRENYYETDIYVRSTDMDRTVMSALSCLAGLYPPKGDQVWNPNLAWQPVPLHTIPQDLDLLLNDHSVCPAFKEMLEDLMGSPEVKNIVKPYKWLFDYLSEHTGLNVTNIFQTYSIYDTLLIEKLHNKTLPEWAKTVFPEKISPLMNISLKLNSWTTPMKRLRSGPVLQEILDRFERFSVAMDSGNMSDSGPRVTILSGHDSSIANVLNALDLYDPPLPPPYASALMVELFMERTSSNVPGQAPSNQFHMKFFYRNESDKEPYLLRLDGCGTGDSCTLEEYKRLTSPLRPEDVATECLLVAKEDMRFEFKVVVTFALLEVILACLFMALLAAILSLQYHKEKTAYRPLLETIHLEPSSTGQT